jgi:hypothetical protein
MLEPMAVACAWTGEHWDELLDARESYDDASRLDRAGSGAPSGLAADQIRSIAMSALSAAVRSLSPVRGGVWLPRFLPYG